MTITINFSVPPNSDFQAEVTVNNVDERGAVVSSQATTVAPGNAHVASVYKGVEVSIREIPFVVPENSTKKSKKQDG